jgi:uncharacterized protein (TIGR02391 family)
MDGMEPFVLTDEQVSALPLDVLALQILRDVIANEEWNSRNWLLAAKAGHGYSDAALRALGEAWDWLHRSGLIATNRTKNTEHAIFVTRSGQLIAQSGSTERMRAADRLTMNLHSALESKVRPQFLMGEYELAAFAAMKAVEVRVREMAGFLDSQIGVPLMNAAFGPNGPLCDGNLDPGERDARRALFAGAIGTIKNPTSHRDVRYDDPTEASETVLLADLLMRILDRVPLTSS